MNGWIKLNRSLADHWLWDEKPFSKGQAWIDLILLANHEDKKFPYKDGVIEGKRGSVYRSISYLAERWGWSREKTTRFLRQLECDGCVELSTTTHLTTVTLVNYGKFQDNHTTDETTETTTSAQQTDSKPTADRQQADTYKNYKNYKELKEDEEDDDITAPPSTVEQVVNAWNQIPHTQDVSGIYPGTRRWDELQFCLHKYGAEYVLRGIDKIAHSAYLKKRGNVRFDNYVTVDQLQKVMEGAYDVDYNAPKAIDYDNIEWS